MSEAKNKAQRDTWLNRRTATEELFAGWKLYQRMAIVMSMKAKRHGLDFDWMLNDSYERLTEELHKEMEAVR